jgi:hypothetical protein
MSFQRSASVLALTLLGLSGTTPTVFGQYVVGGGFMPGGIYGRQGGALYGASQVMNSYGNVVVQQEQARIQREVANQAKLDTKRKAFDEARYERDNTPAWTEEQEKMQAMIVRRIMNQPLPAEVTSGKAQNILLPYVNNLIGTGIQGSPVMIDPNMLAKINVTSPGKGNVGLLRDGGKLRWPPLLRSPEQKKIDALLPTAVSQTIRDELDPTIYTQLNKLVKQMQDDWRKKLHKEEIDGGTYVTGKRYLDDLEGSVAMLVQPGVGPLLSGSQGARGSTVQELVQNMTSQGLTFAPATPGNESAYYALQSALTSYARGAQTDMAFQNRLGPPTSASASAFPK